jgi:hypothetical protein
MTPDAGGAAYATTAATMSAGAIRKVAERRKRVGETTPLSGRSVPRFYVRLWAGRDMRRYSRLREVFGQPVQLTNHLLNPRLIATAKFG